MEVFRDFLESSTIHGLSYMAGAKSNVMRCFWTLAVVASFLVAASLIQASFMSWKESPIISTSTTLPISSARFPIITVCPPDQTNTVINYEIERMKNVSMDKQMWSIPQWMSLDKGLQKYIMQEYHEKFVQTINSFVNIEFIIDMYNRLATFSPPHTNHQEPEQILPSSAPDQAPTGLSRS